MLQALIPRASDPSILTKNKKKTLSISSNSAYSIHEIKYIFTQQKVSSLIIYFHGITHHRYLFANFTTNYQRNKGCGSGKVVEQCNFNKKFLSLQIAITTSSSKH
jgi:hypothetical protein